MKHTNTIARLGRAPAVTLVAATQRPTQKVMGQGAVRSQMNIRIAFRIQEQRDVDVILGQAWTSAASTGHPGQGPAIEEHRDYIAGQLEAQATMGRQRYLAKLRLNHLTARDVPAAEGSLRSPRAERRGRPGLPEPVRAHSAG